MQGFDLKRYMIAGEKVLKAEFLFTNEIVSKRQSQWPFDEKNNEMVYVTGGARSYITVTEDGINEVIKGYDGLFKDVTCKFSEIEKAKFTEDFLFLKTSRHIFGIELNSVYEGSLDEITDKVKAARKGRIKDFFANSKKEDNIPEEARAFFKANSTLNVKKNKLPLSVRFRPNIIGMILFLAYSIIYEFDGFIFDHVTYANITPIFASLLISAIRGFAAGYIYTFYVTWFSMQKEKIRVASIVLFPITIVAFGLMAIVGAIPYTIYLLIKGRTTATFDRIVNVSAVLFGVVAVGLVTYLASIFLI